MSTAHGEVIALLRAWADAVDAEPVLVDLTFDGLRERQRTVDEQLALARYGRFPSLAEVIDDARTTSTWLSDWPWSYPAAG